MNIDELTDALTLAYLTAYKRAMNSLPAHIANDRKSEIATRIANRAIELHEFLSEKQNVTNRG